MKKPYLALCLLTSIIAFVGCSNAGESLDRGEIVPGIPVKNQVTLVDLGSKSCIPCTMMAPILTELKKEYQGRAEVIFLDVHQRTEVAQPFKVRAIPTQIVYDRQGKEVFRHVGFLDKKAMQAEIDRYLALK